MLRFIIDNNLSPLVAGLLRSAGFDAVHVREELGPRSTDEEIFDFAAASDRIIVAADVDFGEILSLRGSTKPSVIILRRRGRSAAAVFDVLSKNLPAVEADLLIGAVVIIEDARVRLRRLPIAR